MDTQTAPLHSDTYTTGRTDINLTRHMDTQTEANTQTWANATKTQVRIYKIDVSATRTEHNAAITIQGLHRYTVNKCSYFQLVSWCFEPTNN